ncbi:MAG: ester cyclase [Pseudomonadota bacterium]
MIPQVLHADVSFRGSLGQETRGHEGFKDYVNAVHAGLSDYTCTIDDLVVQPGKVFARMTFSGTHTADFMGYPVTGKRVSWAGAALFSFSADKVSDIWVLGDLKALETQLVN